MVIIVAVSLGPKSGSARTEPMLGEVAEWSIATDLKSVVPQGTGGSNPLLSVFIPFRLIAAVIH
jgi:hypothetical protein